MREGFTNVMNVGGGTSGWMRAGFAVESYGCSPAG